MRWPLPILLALALLNCGRPAPAPVAPKAAKSTAPAGSLDARLPLYHAGPAVNAILTSIGSDSMDPLFRRWVEDFGQIHPNAQFNLVSKGSATAPKALLDGSTVLGHMSREMNAQELAAFQAKFGYAPTRLVVAVDALALYVHPANPIQKLRMREVDAIFSTTRKGGYDAEVTTWGDLGLGGEWSRRSIQPYGRDENSGTRAFFKEHVLLKGEFKPTVTALADQFAVVEAPAMDSRGISYGPIQYSVELVKAVPIVSYDGGKAVPPTVETILGGQYPMTRFLYLYVNKPPTKPLDPALKEFLTFVLSRNGQASVVGFGAIPIPSDMAAQGMAKIL